MRNYPCGYTSFVTCCKSTDVTCMSALHPCLTDALYDRVTKDECDLDRSTYVSKHDNREFVNPRPLQILIKNFSFVDQHIASDERASPHTHSLTLIITGRGILIKMVVVKQESLAEGRFCYHQNDGLYYHLSYVLPHSAYFKCIWYERGCLGRAILRRSGAFSHSKAHNHGRDFLYSQELLLRRRILDRVLSRQYVSFREIINNERQRFPVDVACRLTYGRMYVQMHRRRTAMFPPIPRSIPDFVAILQSPHNISVTATIDESDNLNPTSAFDAQGNQHVLFISNRMLRFMSNCHMLFADTTFKTTPAIPGFTQVFCISTVWRWHVLPLCWILMSSKSEEAFVAVLMCLRMKLGHYLFSRVVTDFEAALQNAWEIVFNVTVQGCLYHYCAALLRNACLMGLKTDLQYDYDLRLIFAWCCALALLPDEYINLGFFIIGFDCMTIYPDVYQLMRPFFLYVNDEWVASASRRPHMSVSGSLHRTNNASESQNRMLKRAVRTTHPGCYEFLVGIIGMEQSSYIDICSLAQGRNPSRRRKIRYVSNDAQIRALTEDLLTSPDAPMFSTRRFIRAACFKLKGLIDRGLDDL